MVTGIDTRCVVVTFVLAVSLASVAASQTSGERVSGGNGTLYLGHYPQQITVVDEATEQVVDAIHVSIGVPRQLTLSEDLSRFYMIDATYESFEAIDVATHESLHTFTLSDDTRRTRIRGYRVHPNGRDIILVTDTAVKLIDRFEIEPRKLVLYDLHDEVARELEWPTANTRGATRMLFSPDGEYLYYFDDDIVALETTNYTEVDRWAISQPLEDGLGRLTLNFTPDLINEEPGFFSGIFQVRDDLQDRDLMGIARIDLPGRHVDFFTLGPTQSMTFALAPGRQTAYGIAREIGHYEFWTFDLDTRKIVSRRPFSGRPRMDLHVSTNGRLLYVSQAGNTIDLYDAETQDYLRTITFDGDQTTGMIVLP